MSDHRFSSEAPTAPYNGAAPSAHRVAERRADERVRIVAEVSLSSDSQFALPEGEIVAAGTVTWVRVPSEGTAPGVGIAFRALAAEDGGKIVRFCAERPPLYCDLDDRA